MEIKEILKKETWENFLKEIKEKTFLQSWNWGEFQKSLGQKVWRFGFFEKDTLLGSALVIKVSAKRGNFLFVPHGPLIKEEKFSLKKEVLKNLFLKLKELGKKEKVHFLRIAPLWQRNKENDQLFSFLGFKNAPIFLHPEITWELSLEKKDENDILKGMEKRQRWSIKKAIKEKAEVIKSQDEKDLKIFLDLYFKTAKRHHFVPFSKDYLQREFHVFKKDNQVMIFLGKHQGKYLAGAFVIFWQNRAFYHHGASIKSKVPLSSLLQFFAIKEAIKRRCSFYNFWGIAESEDKSHPWYGLTFFKKGFGGEKKVYLRTKDYPLSFCYLLNYVVEKIRRKKRRL